MNAEQIEKCLTEYGTDIYRFCCFLTRGRDLADDLYQESFLKAMEVERTVEDDMMKSFVVGIAANIWKNIWRKEKRRRKIVSTAEFDAEYMYEPAFGDAEQNGNPQDAYIREETRQIYTGIEDGKQYIDFTIKGLSFEDSRTYINTKESTDNKKVCQIIYNDFEENDLSQDLALMVRTLTTENDISSYGVLMTLQIPKAESLPCYVWENADPYNRVVLSNYCYLLEAPGINSSSYEHQNELNIQSEVYVTMKDGTQFCILSDDNKINNECYRTENFNDTQWHSFFNLLDLDMVESFTIDGVTFHTKDATLMK